MFFKYFFKANLIYKDFFKTILYIHVLFKPVRTLYAHIFFKFKLPSFENSADPDQLASSEVDHEGSTPNLGSITLKK